MEPEAVYEMNPNTYKKTITIMSGQMTTMSNFSSLLMGLSSPIGQIRELPDIAKADGSTRRHHDVAESGSPLLGLLLGFDFLTHGNSSQ